MYDMYKIYIAKLKSQKHIGGKQKKIVMDIEDHMSTLRIDDAMDIEELETTSTKLLSQDEIAKLETQNSRLVPEFKANQLEAQAQRHWDIFYKRNETRFFKDRRWTTREFNELLSATSTDRKIMLEVGCGVGNLIFPLIKDKVNNFFIYACDFSPRAVEFVKQNPLYNEENVKAFQCDITGNSVFENIKRGSLDIVTLIFVLSAIHPDKFRIVLSNILELLKPGGTLLFRDYGRYDMAQLRFKPGNKIGENFYMRCDGTRSYYFTDQEIGGLAEEVGFSIVTHCYVHRRTINQKENLDVPRIFVQAKLQRPLF